MPVALLWVSIIIFACVLFNKISGRFGIPALLTFIVLGMIFGSDGIVKIPFDNYALANTVCSTALIFIMFYGGFGTKWSVARPVAVHAALLASIGVILTAGATGLFCHFVLGLPLLEGLLLGSIISSTDAASVFSILRSQKLNLRNNTASMLEIESGSNDPVAYMLTAVMLSVMNGDATAGGILWMLVTQIAVAVLAGLLISSTTLFVLKHYRFPTEGFDAVFMVAVALLSYALPSYLGGNGYLSAYLVGLTIGNRAIQNKKSLVHFFDGITGLMQMMIFFLLGLLSTPSELPGLLGLSVAVMAFLTLVARPLAVAVLLYPFGCSINQILLVSWCGLRGAASIVFAIMAIIHPAYSESAIYHVVFCIVLISISLQGSLIPKVSEKLSMIDTESNVLKTFNDYSEDPDIQFIKLSLMPSHPWVMRRVKNVLFPPECLLILILRNGQRIIPNGNTLLEADDILVLSARGLDQTYDIELEENVLEKGHEWIAKRVQDISLTDKQLIIMIQRNHKIIIPQGKTLLKEDDVLILI